MFEDSPEKRSTALGALPVATPKTNPAGKARISGFTHIPRVNAACKSKKLASQLLTLGLACFIRTEWKISDQAKVFLDVETGSHARAKYSRLSSSWPCFLEHATQHQKMKS